MRARLHIVPSCRTPVPPELVGAGGDASAHFAMVGRLQHPDGTFTDTVSAISSDNPPPTSLVSLTLRSGADQTYGELHFNSALTARVTPVPEPGALAMLAGGLGLLGARARVRRAAGCAETRRP